VRKFQFATKNTKNTKIPVSTISLVFFVSGGAAPLCGSEKVFVPFRVSCGQLVAAMPRWALCGYTVDNPALRAGGQLLLVLGEAEGHSMTQQRLAFRSAILPLYVVTLLGTIVGFVGGFLFRHGLAVEVDWEAVGERFLWAAVGVFVFVVAAAALFRVYVSAEGLRCYTFFGNYHTLSWPEIDSVRPINLLGLRYLRVGSSQSGYTVWVPLYLADMPRFRAAVREFAGEGHTLARALA
jgi:hypothetical protein